MWGGCGSRWHSSSGEHRWPCRARRWATVRTWHGSRGRRFVSLGCPLLPLPGAFHVPETADPRARGPRRPASKQRCRATLRRGPEEVKWATRVLGPSQGGESPPSQEGPASALGGHSCKELCHRLSHPLATGSCRPCPTHPHISCVRVVLGPPGSSGRPVHCQPGSDRRTEAGPDSSCLSDTV